jgi:Domain of unknown function (DUF4296)
MFKRILFLGLIILMISCKEQTVKKPDILIEKDVMIDIMYDLSLLEAMRFQTVKPLEKYNLNPSHYIYKKYKIDSVQFVQNNMYYAADYKEYKKMNEEINARLDKNKIVLEALIKKQKSKAVALEKLKSKRKKQSDSLAKIKNNSKGL